MNYDLDLDFLDAENQRYSTKPGQKKSTITDFIVKMPPAEGFVIVRLLPAKDGEKIFTNTRTHRLALPEPDKWFRNYHCPKVHNPKTEKWEGDCVVCDYWYDVWSKIRATEKGSAEYNRLFKLAGDIKPVERFYWNVIVRRGFPANLGQSPESGVLILSIGKILQAKITTAIMGNKKMEIKGRGNVAHPKTGIDFKIVKEIKPGEEKWPEYKQSDFEEAPSVLGTDSQINAWMSSLHDLKSLRRLSSYEEMVEGLKIFTGKAKPTNRTQFDSSILEGDCSARECSSSHSNHASHTEEPHVESPKPKATTVTTNKISSAVAAELKAPIEDPDLALADDPWVKDFNEFNEN